MTIKPSPDPLITSLQSYLWMRGGEVMTAAEIRSLYALGPSASADTIRAVLILRRCSVRMIAKSMRTSAATVSARLRDGGLTTVSLR